MGYTIDYRGIPTGTDVRTEEPVVRCPLCHKTGLVTERFGRYGVHHASSYGYPTGPFVHQFERDDPRLALAIKRALHPGRRVAGWYW